MAWSSGTRNIHRKKKPKKTDNLAQTVEVTVHLLEPLRSIAYLDHVFFAEAPPAPETHSAAAVGGAEM